MAQTGLENGAYIKVDTIFIKVVVEASDLSDPWRVTGEVDWAEGNSSVGEGGGVEPLSPPRSLHLEKDPVEQEGAEGLRGWGDSGKSHTEDIY